LIVALGKEWVERVGIKSVHIIETNRYGVVRIESDSINEQSQVTS
jgi:hypothetical protein